MAAHMYPAMAISSTRQVTWPQPALLLLCSGRQRSVPLEPRRLSISGPGAPGIPGPLPRLSGFTHSKLPAFCLPTQSGGSYCSVASPSPAHSPVLSPPTTADLLSLDRWDNLVRENNIQTSRTTVGMNINRLQKKYIPKCQLVWQKKRWFFLKPLQMFSFSSCFIRHCFNL